MSECTIVCFANSGRTWAAPTFATFDLQSSPITSHHYSSATKMEQIQEQVMLMPYQHLDTAASQITNTLQKAGFRLAFIGGYSATLLGGRRMTKVRFQSS